MDWLSELSKDLEDQVRPEPRFVLYGATRASSILDVARAVAARTE